MKKELKAAQKECEKGEAALRDKCTAFESDVAQLAEAIGEEAVSAKNETKKTSYIQTCSLHKHRNVSAHRPWNRIWPNWPRSSTRSR